MDRNLALEFVRVTEAAAIAAASWIGRGDKNAADQAAVDRMRTRFNQIDFRGRIVIGEGTKDEAPMLYIGEIVGKAKEPKMDIAVDPLDGTSSVAFGRMNAISVIVTGSHNSLMSFPDDEPHFYIDKLAVGPVAAKVIDITAPVKVNLQKIAKALGKRIGDVTVLVLDRDRHVELIADIRKAGARIQLLTDGDVAGAIATCLPETGVDVLMGLGGATESVLAAGALKILGGEILCKFKNEKRIYAASDLAKGSELTFTATGVIDGPLLQGVKFLDHTTITHSVVMRATSGTIRYITTHHHANK